METHTHSKQESMYDVLLCLSFVCCCYPFVCCACKLSLILVSVSCCVVWSSLAALSVHQVMSSFRVACCARSILHIGLCSGYRVERERKLYSPIIRRTSPSHLRALTTKVMAMKKSVVKKSSVRAMLKHVAECKKKPAMRRPKAPSARIVPVLWAVL
jgi:hypothetical protein